MAKHFAVTAVRVHARRKTVVFSAPKTPPLVEKRIERDLVEGPREPACK
jgi:hypothetical protein